MKVRKANQEDVKQIKSLLTKTWKETYSDILSKSTIRKISSSWHAPDKLADQIKNTDILFLVVEDNNKNIIGILSGRVSNSKEFDLDRLYVHPNHQQKGIGSHLLEEAINCLSHLEEINLQVLQKNIPAISFWKNKNFKPIRREKMKIQDDTVQIINMKRNLT